MRILWVEDDPEISKKTYFGSSILDFHDVQQVRDLYKAYLEVDNNLDKYDYVVIDINLINSVFGEKAEKLKNKFGMYKDSQFLQEAGFHIYIKLMEKGFPKERIIFFSANVSKSSNFNRNLKEVRFALDKKNASELKSGIDKLANFLDGPQAKTLKKLYNSKSVSDLEEFLKQFDSKKTSKLGTNETREFEDLELHFSEARISIPNEAISKDNKAALNEWFEPRLNYSNSKDEDENSNFTKDYLTLRRGILNVLDDLEEKKTKLISDKVGKSSFDEELNKSAFFEGIRWLLQAHELSPEQAGKFYLTLCDYLTKPFELFSFRNLIQFPSNDDRNNEDRNWRLNWIERRSSMIPAYFLRNWIAHGLISGSTNTPEFTSHDASFTFLIVMKSLFGKETYGNKKELKRLFRDDSNITLKSIRGQIVKLHGSTYRTPYLSEKLEEIERRGQKNKKQNTNEKIYWKNQNFLFHFFASYLLASADLSSNTCKPNNKYNEQDYTVFLDYGIQETSFLNIASKMFNNQPPKKI